MTIKKITATDKQLLKASCREGKYFVRVLIKKFSKNGKVVITQKRILEGIELFQKHWERSKALQGICCSVDRHVIVFLDNLVDIYINDKYPEQIYYSKLFRNENYVKGIEKKFFKEIERLS